RDFHVTGVQTCALPILASIRWSTWSARMNPYPKKKRRRVLNVSVPNGRRQTRRSRRLAVYGSLVRSDMSPAVLTTSCAAGRAGSARKGVGEGKSDGLRE